MSENTTANAINHVFVTSDGDGFMITSPHISAISVGDAIAFTIKYYVDKSTFDDEFNALIKPLINNNRELSARIHAGTYYYEPNQITSNDELIAALKVAFQVICVYPSDFAHYITGAHFSEQSAWGLSLFEHDTRKSGIIGRYLTNESKVVLRDSTGNEVMLIPKAIHNLPNEVIPELSSLDFTTMKNTVNAVSSSLRSQVKSLRVNIKAEAENAYKRGYDAGMSVLTDMPPGWSIGNVPGVIDKCFIWTGDFHPHYIDVGGGTVYKIPDEVVPLLRISGLAVKMGDKLVAVYGKGHYPHIEGIENIQGDDDHWHGVCIGSLNNEPFSRINELLPMFDTINANSMHGGTPSRIVRYLIGDDMYTVDDDNTIRNSSGQIVTVNDPLWIPVYKWAGRLNTSEHNANDTIWRI